MRSASHESPFERPGPRNLRTDFMANPAGISADCTQTQLSGTLTITPEAESIVLGARRIANRLLYSNIPFTCLQV